jgi:branched-chain amino acid transport system substrate-binding protein
VTTSRRLPTLAVLLAMLVGACGTGTPPNVRIGVIAPLTGTRAWLGQEVVAGARLAIEDINEAGGLLGEPVELVVADDADLTSLPGQLSDLAERSRVSAVIGPEAPGVLVGPRSPLTRRAVPSLLPSAFGGALDTASTFVARTVPSARAQATALGRWLRHERGIRQVAVLMADPIEGDLARDDLVDGLTSGGVDVVAVVEADGDAPDLRPSVAVLQRRAGDVGAVLLWGPPASAARATEAVRFLDWDVQVAVPASSFVAEYRTLGGDAIEGVVAVFPFDQAWFTGDLVTWMLRYQLRYGLGLLPQLDTLVIDIPVSAVAAYDAVRLVAQAVMAAESRVPADVARELAAGRFEGLLRTYELEQLEAWTADDLYVARFHELALTFDVDPRLDLDDQIALWRAQVTLDLFPAGDAPPPIQALLDRIIGERRADPPAYQPPLPGPEPVARP